MMAGKLTSRKAQTLIGIGHASSPINGGTEQSDTRGAGKSFGRNRLDVDAPRRHTGRSR